MRSSAACSSSESTSFIVETRCCASTARHATVSMASALARSSSRVQVLEDIEETADFLDQVGRLAAERDVVRLEPLRRDLVVAAHDRIERAVDAHEQRRQLERLLV